MDKKIARNKAGQKKNQGHFASNSTQSQRARLLDVLSTGNSISTIEARRNLDILAPAPRIKELKNKGHNIIKHMVSEPTDCGKLHRVARYYLFREVK